MATPQDKLAESLAVLKKLQDEGTVAIHTKNMTRTHRERHHPYVDGNGHMGRFLMNVMLASGAYPWTVIPIETRNDYMAALEEASVRQNIEPFSRFLTELVQKGIKQ